MSNSALQLTLREMRRFFTTPKTLTGMAVAILILGISGPFETFETFPLGPRLAYWTAQTIATFGVGSFFGTWFAKATGGFHQFGILRFALNGFAAGLPVTGAVLLVNAAATGTFEVGDLHLSVLAFYCVIISIAVSVMFAVLSPGKSDSVLAQNPRILQRLPLDKRGALISLSVQDHYVEVATAKGKALILMRLSDAISETEGANGLQVHRSHWVALDAVKTTQRRQGKILIELSNGAELPVSRSFVPKVREAGLLP